MPSAEYYRRVVDCQQACPTHTPVPQYIQAIIDGDYNLAYKINRDSNVFPGILGRVCDRPCEPKCRRGRVDDTAIAICSLKRIAADYRDKLNPNYLPKPGKPRPERVALIGAGPASLTVANDLLQKGYSCELFEKDNVAGGAMRRLVPLFRLPPTVLDEEIQYITDLGLKCHFNHEVTSLQNLLAEYAAVFIGTGAVNSRPLNIPGRPESGVWYSLDFLRAISFEELTQLPGRALVIGGGNTAMDCCRSLLRLGASVTVVAPEAFSEMLASPWERTDAQREGVKFLNSLLPTEFLQTEGRLCGVEFREVLSLFKNGQWRPELGEAQRLDCDYVVVAIGQSCAFPFIEPSLNLVTDGKLQVNTNLQSATVPKVFAGGDALGPSNIISAVAAGHQAANSIHHFLSGATPPQVKPRLVSQRMGLRQWSYEAAYTNDARAQMPHLPVASAISQPSAEVELGLSLDQAIVEAKRCLFCHVQTVLEPAACIECNACIDVCPVSCLSLQSAGELASSAAAVVTGQQVCAERVPQTGKLMVKDENLCLHCGLCAERCPTAAWDMRELVEEKMGV